MNDSVAHRATSVPAPSHCFIRFSARLANDEGSGLYALGKVSRKDAKAQVLRTRELPGNFFVSQIRRYRQGETSFEFLGFEFRWGVNRKGQAWLKRRTARKKLRNSLKRVTEWF